jgi:hypothetical protein
MVGQIDKRVIESLCPELQLLLAEELANGNAICETKLRPDIGVDGVWLLHRLSKHSLPTGVVYNIELDPRDRYEEYYCTEHRKMISASLDT